MILVSQKKKYNGKFYFFLIIIFQEVKFNIEHCYFHVKLNDPIMTNVRFDIDFELKKSTIKNYKMVKKNSICGKPKKKKKNFLWLP